MRASDIMSAPVYVIAPTETIAHARNLMFKHKCSRLPVIDGDSLIGIITKKDIALGLTQREPVWRRRPIDMIPVDLLMKPSPVTIEPQSTIPVIAALMIEKNISGLPVMEDNELQGIVTKSDIMRSEHVTRLSVDPMDLIETVITSSRYHSLDHVIDIIREQNNKVVVVNNDGTLAGIITESNLAFYQYMDDTTGMPTKDIRLLRKERAAGEKRLRYVVNVSVIAEDVMSRPVITARLGDGIQDVIALINKNHINSVVIVDGQELRGIITRDRILQEVAK